MYKNKNCTSFTNDLHFISNLNLKQYQPWPGISNWLFTWLQWTFYSSKTTYSDCYELSIHYDCYLHVRMHCII